MNNELIYVYCLTNSKPELETIEGPRGLRSILVEGFYVIVRDVSADDFSEASFKKHLSDLMWLESNARDHIEIINIIMNNSSVIPFKFGTIFQEEDSVKKFVADYSDSLTENFRLVGGREEWALKIYCDRKALCHQIDELSEEAAALENQIMSSSPGKAYLLKRKKADLIETEMNRISKIYGQKYFDEFSNLSERTNLNNLLPKEITGREDTMILNATFLVNKNKVTDFKDAAELFVQKDRNSGFTLEMTGPWPPFSFISIKEKAHGQ